MAQANRIFRHANTHQILLDGKLVGGFRSVTLDTNFGVEGQYQIGDIDPVENIPNRAEYRVSVEQMVLRRTSLKDQGLQPENGAAALQGVVFDIVVLDKETGEPLLVHRGATFESGSVDVRASSVISSRASFRCLTTAGTGL